MNEMRLARKIIHTLFKDKIHYPTRLIAETGALVARCAILLYLYWHIFQLRGGVIGGLTYEVAAWSIFLYFSINALRLREVTRTIMSDVRSGTVEILFNKPISYLPYRAWWQIGSSLLLFFLIALGGGLTLTALVGVPAIFWSVPHVLTTILTFGLSITLTFLLYTIVGLCAFWIEEVNPLFWITDKAIMILGGSYLPVALFPGFLAAITRYTPFGASQFLTHTVYTSWDHEWPIMLGIQLTWIIILLAIVTWMSRAAHRKLSINGG